MGYNNPITEYYNGHCFDEEHRLSNESTEFLVTKTLISQILKDKDKILDLGGGTGVYALPLCCDGHEVTLVDLSKKELEIAKQKSDELGRSIKIVEANAATYNDEYLYDVILCLGPMYHCSSINEVMQIIENVLQRLQKGGYAFFSFISKYAKFNRFIKEINLYKKHDIDKINEILMCRCSKDSTFIFETRGDLPVSFVEPLSIGEFLKNYNVDIVDILSVDLCQSVKEFNHEIFNILYTLGKGCMINNGEHIISIIKKR